jgi:hypothetical protein
MTRLRAAGLLASCGALALGCEGADCAGIGRPAFEVGVVDARSGAPIADSAVVYVFRLPDLVRVDSVLGRSASERIWTSERTGRFNVVVERLGYFPWTTENREVTSACSVRTVSLTARLLPRAAGAAAP